MALGVADRFWTIANLLAAALAQRASLVVVQRLRHLVRCTILLRPTGDSRVPITWNQSKGDRVQILTQPFEPTKLTATLRELGLQIGKAE
jgi:hypothetical protein